VRLTWSEGPSPAAGAPARIGRPHIPSRFRLPTARIKAGRLPIFDNTSTIGTDKHCRANLTWSVTGRATCSPRTTSPLPIQFVDDQACSFRKLVAAREQKPALFSFEVKGFVARICCEFRKLPAFASTAIAIRNLLTQVVQHVKISSTRRPCCRYHVFQNVG